MGELEALPEQLVCAHHRILGHVNQASTTINNRTARFRAPPTTVREV
jgi:hypothetical protein